MLLLITFILFIASPFFTCYYQCIFKEVYNWHFFFRFYLRRLADELSHVNGPKVVHKESKLGNMFLSENMTVKIGYFDLAARLHADSKV